MMRGLLQVWMVVALMGGLCACGYKGKLKTPTQVQAHEEKKARKAAALDNGESQPADLVSPVLGDEEGAQQNTGVNVVVTPSNDVAQ